MCYLWSTWQWQHYCIRCFFRLSSEWLNRLTTHSAHKCPSMILSHQIKAISIRCSRYNSIVSALWLSTQLLCPLVFYLTRIRLMYKPPEYSRTQLTPSGPGDANRHSQLPNILISALGTADLSLQEHATCTCNCIPHNKVTNNNKYNTRLDAMRFCRIVSLQPQLLLITFVQG